MQALLRRYYPGLKLASCSPFRVAGFVPVILVLGIIILAYITAVPATLLRVRAHHPFIVALLLILFHLVFLSTLVNYLLLVFLDPGSPPDDWKAALPSTFPYERAPPGEMPGALAEARVLAERERFRGAEGESAEREAMIVQRCGEGDAEGGEECFRYAADMRERAYDGMLRYCRKCKAFKPDRSHHCSVCRRCILRMDHHCVFVNNCVSFYNYKFFILFVTYAFVGCLFVAVVSLPTFLALVSVSPRRRVSEGGGEKWAEGSARTGWMEGWADVRGMSTTMQMLVVVGYITTAAFALALSVFVALHFYLVAKGRTTIEMYELTDPVRAARVAEYDLGPARNFRNVFGSVVACWFLPTRAYVSGDGLQFERRELTDQNISEV